MDSCISWNIHEVSRTQDLFRESLSSYMYFPWIGGCKSWQASGITASYPSRAAKISIQSREASIIVDLRLTHGGRRVQALRDDTSFPPRPISIASLHWNSCAAPMLCIMLSSRTCRTPTISAEAAARPGRKIRNIPSYSKKYPASTAVCRILAHSRYLLSRSPTEVTEQPLLSRFYTTASPGLDINGSVLVRRC